MGFECRKNCSTVFTQSSNRIRHENERCVIFGACEQSKKIDGTLLHASKIFQELVDGKQRGLNNVNGQVVHSPTTVITNTQNIHHNNSVVNNNTNTDNSVINHATTINNGHTNVFVQLSKTEWEKSSKKEKDEINAVLRLFRETGCNTAEQIQHLILNKYNTIQAFERRIKNCTFVLMRSIAIEQSVPPTLDNNEGCKEDEKKTKALKQKNQKLEEEEKTQHFKRCILTFYDKILVQNINDTQISTEMILASPIFKPKEGGLKVWNRIKTKQTLDSFGNIDTPGSYPGWTTMHESNTWKKIITIIANKFVDAFKAEEDIDTYNKRDDSEELEELAKYWNSEWLYNEDNLTKKSETFESIGKEMSRRASIASSLDPHRGWYRLTDVVAEVEYRLHNLLL